jgi:hypothetical protein
VTFFDNLSTLNISFGAGAASRFLAPAPLKICGSGSATLQYALQLYMYLCVSILPYSQEKIAVTNIGKLKIKGRHW